MAVPMLAIRDAAAAVAFYERAFGAVEAPGRIADPAGRVLHTQVTINGTAPLMIAEEWPGHNASPATLGGTTVILHVYVPDVDAFVARAVAAGATVVAPAMDQFYGDRSAKLADPFGHVWMFATHREDVPPAELQRRAAAMFGGGA
jgi:PhnB protein